MSCRGRALGVMLILATQKPDKGSLPTGVSSNVGTRFCLRVMGQVENDRILGTSSYRNGIRATTLTRSDKGIGYLVGATDAPTVTRVYYLDAEASDAMAARAYALREAAGLLTGQALGEATEKAPTYNLLDDVRAVFANLGGHRVWHSGLLAQLIALRPEVYGDWDVRRLGVELRNLGVPTQQIALQLDDGERQTATLPRRRTHRARRPGARGVVHRRPTPVTAVPLVPAPASTWHRYWPHGDKRRARWTSRVVTRSPKAHSTTGFWQRNHAARAVPPASRGVEREGRRHDSTTESVPESHPNQRTTCWPHPREGQRR